MSLISVGPQESLINLSDSDELSSMDLKDGSWAGITSHPTAHVE